MAGNFISIDRNITEWEWYKNPNTKVVFLHCLLKANWKDGSFEGQVIPRGSFVTSLQKLSEELALTIRQARTALSHLEMTGELTSKSTNRYRIITVVKYDEYQNPDRRKDSQATSKRQATGQSSDNNRTIEQYNKGTSIDSADKPERKREVFAPPTLDDVKGYCQEKCYGIDAERFYDFYVSKGWMVGKNKMKDWKAAVRNWARTDKSKTTTKAKKDNFSNFHERDDMDWDAYELALLKKR